MSALRDWQARVRLSDRAAAEELGISYGTYTAMIGTRSRDSAPRPLDERTAWACAAIEAGLQPDCPEWADRRTVLAMAALAEGLNPIGGDNVP